MERKYEPGDKRVNTQGFEMTLIERLPNCRCIVEFDDEYHTRKECDTYSFGQGKVKNPNSKRARGAYAESFIIQRTGAENVNYENEVMKVVAYRSSTDIDVQFQDEYMGVVRTTWAAFKSGHVKNPNQKKTGIIHHPSGWVDLAGKTFNNLEVLCWDTNPPETENIKNSFTGLWKCRCLICGNYAWATGDQLKRGNRKSCRECGLKAKSKRKKSNEYDLSGEFGIGFTYDTGKIFYFDKEDFDLIRDYSWGENTNGYIVSIKKNKEVLMHRLVLGLERSDGKVVDHINHNVWDNRKSMLRITTTAENVRNHSVAKNNKSGKTGVRFDEESGLWEAYIWHGCNRRLGKYRTIEEAIDARLEAEDKYFGEYSYDNSLRMGDKNEREMF